MIKKPYLIGISGGSGSGKTLFLKSFIKHFSSDDASIISLDDYYLPPGNLTHEGYVRYNFDVPASFDEERFTDDIQKLLDGGTVHKKEYKFNNRDLPPEISEIHSAPIVIIEGLFIFHFQKVAELINLKIFIDADEDVALQRRIKRDIKERNYTPDDVMFKWTNHVLPSYQTYLLPHKETADRVILNNSHVAEDILGITKEMSHELKESVLGVLA